MAGNLAGSKQAQREKAEALASRQAKLPVQYQPGTQAYKDYWTQNWESSANVVDYKPLQKTFAQATSTQAAYGTWYKSELERLQGIYDPNSKWYVPTPIVYVDEPAQQAPAPVAEQAPVTQEAAPAPVVEQPKPKAPDPAATDVLGNQAKNKRKRSGKDLANLASSVAATRSGRSALRIDLNVAGSGGSGNQGGGLNVPGSV